MSPLLLIRAIEREAGRRPKIGVYPRWMMWFAGFFDRQKREILEVLHQFEEPFVGREAGAANMQVQGGFATEMSSLSHVVQCR
ncbi:MAG TPA: hypothetical protein VGR27_15655 [Longimicrobiaceae bacterium]|nr:hypothetical protein [Longimicrobiaceae bacterium]